MKIRTRVIKIGINKMTNDGIKMNIRWTDKSLVRIINKAIGRGKTKSCNYWIKQALKVITRDVNERERRT